ncbi:MAG TPA: hypothetical protein VLG36_00160 [Candidatus Chromulinivoraceae bacterium]|nr:hypothetical protein [Candidatus Chromulinivoraceae bacterium]
MYPDQNQQQPNQPSPTPQPQYSIDYLNQIAPKSQKNGLSNRLFLMIAIGGGLLAVIIGAFMLFGGGGGPTTDMQHLTARIESLSTVATTAQKNIKSNSLSGTNSNLVIFFTNADRDIATPLKNNGLDIKKLDKTIVTSEAETDLSAKLEDARLNAVFDRTYAREMSYQLATVQALMKKIYNSTNSKSMKDYLSSTNTNLIPLVKQFNDFSATSA